MHLRGGLLYLFFIFPHPWVGGSVAEYTPLRFLYKKKLFLKQRLNKSTLLDYYQYITIRYRNTKYVNCIIYDVLWIKVYKYINYKDKLWFLSNTIK